MWQQQQQQHSALLPAGDCLLVTAYDRLSPPQGSAAAHQQASCPVAIMPHVCSSPAATDLNAQVVLIGAGAHWMNLSSTHARPHSPCMFSPQHHTLPVAAAIAHACCEPALTVL